MQDPVNLLQHVVLLENNKPYYLSNRERINE
jgi:hypothetical protein